MFHAGYLIKSCFVASEVNSQCCISALVIFYTVWLLCCACWLRTYVLCFSGFPLCVWNHCRIAFMFMTCSIDCMKPWVRIKSIQYLNFKMSGFQILLSGAGPAKPKMLTKLVIFSARWSLTCQLWEFQHCEAMLRVRSTKQKLHRHKSKMLTLDTLLVTKRIPLIVITRFLLLPQQLLKQYLLLLTWAKTYIA